MYVVPRLRRSTILVIRLPALPGWADVWFRPYRPGFDLGFIFAFSRRAQRSNDFAAFVYGLKPVPDLFAPRKCLKALNIRLLQARQSPCTSSYGLDFRGFSFALLAAHPTVHQGLRTARPTQMPDLRSVGEQHIPCRQPQHRLLRSTGNEGRWFGQSQPPVLRVPPWFRANIAVVSLCKRHTKNHSIPRGYACLPYATST